MLLDSVVEELLVNYPMEEYHVNHIVPLDKKFSYRTFYTSKTVLCPFHNDTDPSLGIFTSRKDKRIKIVRCFANCGAYGNIIDIHMRLSRVYFNKVLTYEEAVRDLCSERGIEIPSIMNIKDDDIQMASIKRRMKIKKAMSMYTIRNYQTDLLNIRLAKDVSMEERINAINNATVKSLVTRKGLLN